MMLTRLLQALIDQGFATEKQIAEAKKKQGLSSKTITDILVEMNVINEDTLVNVVSCVYNIPIYDFAPESEKIDALAVAFIPYEKAKASAVFPIRKEGDTLIVAMSDPFDVLLIDNVGLMTSMKIKSVLVSKHRILELIEKYYKTSATLNDLLETINEEYTLTLPSSIKANEPVVNIETLKGDTSPVVKLINLIFTGAIKSKASDIHIEPQKDDIEIRYRIDGELFDITKLSKGLLPALVARIKIISELDIAETRSPQDGRSSISMNGRSVDLRISTIPTVHGEKVELRILDPKEARVDIADIGFDDESVRLYKEKLNSPQGMILVTGPTGSGKTSTLYASLNYIRRSNKNIVTIEDPVEFMISGINQIQLNPTKNVTFVTGLRSILRQDPDVILVGEIRDKETSDIAFRASLTGHLVLSTLHTNNAVSTITRLFDIGLEPYMISSSLIIIIAQRLVRKICPHCKEPYIPQDNLLKQFDLYIRKSGITTFYKGMGCGACNSTGYYRRTAIFEMMPLNEKIKSLINDRVSEEVLFFNAKKEGMISMAESGVRKVAEGITTLEEVAKVAEVVDVDISTEQPNKVIGEITILVAEDEEDLLKVVEKNLITAGYKVLKARDGDELVEIAVETHPHLIISDVTMPKKNGFEALKILKERMETANIPVMMLTARDDKESELIGLGIGADEYLPKPYDSEKLLARIRLLLRRIL